MVGVSQGSGPRAEINEKTLPKTKWVFEEIAEGIKNIQPQVEKLLAAVKRAKLDQKAPGAYKKARSIATLLKKPMGDVTRIYPGAESEGYASGSRALSGHVRELGWALQELLKVPDQIRQEEEDKARQEAQQKAQQEAAEKARQEAEKAEKAREKARQEAEEKARQEAGTGKTVDQIKEQLRTDIVKAVKRVADGIVDDLKKQLKRQGESFGGEPEVEQTSLSDVGSRLKRIRLGPGGRAVRVDSNGETSWEIEPANRERLDHYVGEGYDSGEDDDSEGWDESGWRREYADPMEEAAQKWMDEEFGPGLLQVDEVSDKGYVYVSLTSKAKQL